MAELGSILEGGVIGVAVGGAAAAVVEPALEPARQEAEKESQARILDLRELATLVAQALQTPAEVLDDAHRNGFHDDQLAAAIQLALRAPGVAEALTLYRRAGMDEGGHPFGVDLLHRAYAKAQIEYQYWAALDSLADLPLDPSIIANAIVRDHMTAPFPLPYAPPAAAGKVASFPKSALNAKEEAAASGVNVDRLLAMVAVTGRPMAPDAAARATFRAIIDPSDFERAILEGDIRGEWGPAIFDLSREILSAREYVEAEVRGQTDGATRAANTAKHGMSQADSDLLYQISGRGIAPRAITTAIARGGVYPGAYANVPEPYRSAIERSLTRPEFAELAYANRYSYPSAFVLKSLATAGDLGDAAAVEQLLLEIGWKPDLAAKVAAKWAPAGGAAAGPTDPHIKSAITTTVTAIRKAYVGRQLTAAQANTYVQQAESAGTLTGVWDVLHTVDNLPAAPPLVDPATLVAEAQALGYTVHPPPPPPPAPVVALEALGYTVTKP